MNIWEHYLYGETSYIEAILQVPGASGLEYLVYGNQISGGYATTLTVATARAAGILDGTTFPEQEPPDPSYPPDDLVIAFENLLPWAQTAITDAYARTQADFHTAQTQAEIMVGLAGLPEDISDVVEYAPNGHTNETQLLYARKEQRQDFLDWLEKQPANKKINHWHGFYRDFKLKLVFVIADNKKLQAAQPYSSYGVIPVEWQKDEY